jgi:hypothetical protein
MDQPQVLLRTKNNGFDVGLFECFTAKKTILLPSLSLGKEYLDKPKVLRKYTRGGVAQDLQMQKCYLSKE